MDEEAKKMALCKLKHDEEIIELEYHHFTISYKIMDPLVYTYQLLTISQERQVDIVFSL